MAAGTLSVTNNSKAVVGVGTTFTAFKAGDFLTLVVGQVPYTVAIASIESATALTLVLPFDGPTATGLAWDGVKRDTMSLATMGVTVQAQKALRLMLADENNWRAIFGDEEEVTVTLPNGQVMQGMSWGYLSQLMKEIDPVEMRNLQQQAAASEAAAQGFRNEAEGFKTETAGIRDATDQIKADTQAIHDATNTIKTQTDQIKADTQAIMDQTDQIKTDTGVIRDEANAAKTDAQAARDAAQGYRDQAEEWVQSVNPDNLLTKDDNLASVENANTARANINAASLGANGFAGNQTIIQEYPQLRLETTSVGNDVVGKTFAIENTIGGHASMIFLNNEIIPELRIATIVKPSNTRPVYIPFNGGLADDGNSVPNSYAGDFNYLQQGWSRPDSAPANPPYSGGIYGSCFTQCAQGTQFGPPKPGGTDGLWYFQRFHDTSNNIYIRSQGNTDAWRPWSRVTTSAVSDERLKDIYGDLDLSEALDNICKMEFKNFKFKDDEKLRQRRGVISQQIMNIDKEYVWEVGGYYHLDQTPMLLDGLAAIKALRARDEANKAEIAELKAAIEELKSEIATLKK